MVLSTLLFSWLPKKCRILNALEQILSNLPGLPLDKNVLFLK